jgi:hypothetical protein
MLVPGATRGSACADATAVYALVQNSSTVWIDRVASNGTVSEAPNPITTINGGVNIAGYSPNDCNLYIVAQGDGSVWRIAPASGTATAVGSSAPLSVDPNARAMVVLGDGTLVYVGNDASQNSDGVHIVPSRATASPMTVVVPVDSSGNATTLSNGAPTFPSPWAIGIDGTIYTWDGGNRHAAV